MQARERVLIFPAGSEIGMEIHRSLQYSHHLELVGASGRSDHARFVYPPDRYVEDDRLYLDHPDFLERFNALLDAHGIAWVYPTHDDVALRLSELQPALHATVVSSPAPTHRVARSKRLTYARFAAMPWCPEVYATTPAAEAFPVFVKPDRGLGGKGARLVRDLETWTRECAASEDLVTMEHLPGEELSVDCVTDRHGTLRFVGPRTRERVTTGISYRSTSVDPDDAILDIAAHLNESLPLRGAWFFQVKRDAHGAWKLLEFSPRQASTMGLYRAAGVNFALLSYFVARGLDIRITRIPGMLTLDRCLHNRFATEWPIRAVYIDLDETIIDGTRTHPRIMAFLYQCRNKGIPLTLVTKHRHDLAATLEHHGIAASLFARVVHLGPDEPKWPHVTDEGAVFIDNHYAERDEVHRMRNIPVFDVDAVECLLD